jgi:hypothetical protein
MTPHRHVRRALGALLILVTLLGGTAGPAAAHDGPGTFVVESDQPSGTSHAYVVRLNWDNDGHPAAADTTVTATAIAPDGTAQTPQPMTSVDAEGRFEATVDLPGPGRWTVRFASVEPTARLDVAVDVTAPTTTTAAPTTTSTTEPEPGEPVDTENAASNAADDEDDGGSATGPIAAVIVVLALAVAAVLVIRHRRQGPAEG